MAHYIEHFACVDFTEFLFPPYSFNRTGLGLGLIVFGLGLTRHVWSRSRYRSHSLWAWSWSQSHCVVVSLTSLQVTSPRSVVQVHVCLPVPGAPWCVLLQYSNML